MINHFGVYSDPSLPAKVNLYNHLLSLPVLFLSSRLSNPSCHNLCEFHSPPKHFRSLLGLGLKFCPTPEFTTSSNHASRIFDRFRDDLYTKIQFCHLRFSEPWDPKQLYIRSPDWTPEPTDVPLEACGRISNFEAALKPHFKRRTAPHNLTPSQLRLLRSLTKHKDVIVAPSDKNLGPVILDRDVYVKKCLQNHLLSPTYKQLSLAEANAFVEDTKGLIDDFVSEHSDSITEGDLTYLQRYASSVYDPFAYFYALIKVHKSPWQTRPIVSVSGSLLYGVGKWLDRQLQPFVKELPTYLSSSHVLKKHLDRMNGLPRLSQCSLFTGDIVAMYPSIEINHAFATIAAHLDLHDDCTYEQEQAILSALHLVMKRNCFCFGDTYWQQTDGTAMGTPPAPSFASLYYGIFELELYLEFSESLFYLKRYIDDQFGIWVHHPDPVIDRERWESFQARQQSFCSLNWVFSSLSKRVNFLDLTIHLEAPALFTTLYEKPSNLHLFIPWNSAHAPAVRSSVVISDVFRTLDLTSRRSDQLLTLRQHFKRFLARGFPLRFLRATFQHALDQFHSKQHRRHLRTPESELLNPNPDFQPNPTDEIAFFHIQYHSLDPSRRTIQSAFRTHILHPTMCKTKLLHRPLAEPHNPYCFRSRQTRPYEVPEAPFDELRNLDGSTIPINRLIVAYRRPPNLKNILFPRHVEAKCPSATPVSQILLAEQQPQQHSQASVLPPSN